MPTSGKDISKDEKDSAETYSSIISYQDLESESISQTSQQNSDSSRNDGNKSSMITIFTWANPQNQAENSDPITNDCCKCRIH